MGERRWERGREIEMRDGGGREVAGGGDPLGRLGVGWVSGAGWVGVLFPRFA